MHISGVIVPTVFALSILAAPASPNVSRALSPAQGRSPDACGPTIQQPTDPKDTCTTAPSSSSNTTGFMIGSLDNGRLFVFDWTICNPVVNTTCDTMALANTTKGTWHFATSQVELDYGSRACQMGFYLPSDPLAAKKPAKEQCLSILGSLVKEAVASRYYWYGATINLKVNPADAEGQWELPNAVGTGEAINAGYPSYVMQAASDNGPKSYSPHAVK